MEYSKDGDPTIFMTEVSEYGEVDQSGESGLRSAGRRDAQGIEERNTSSGNQSEVQSMHKEDQSDMQQVSERDSERDFGKQTELPVVQAEITAEEETAQEIEVLFERERSFIVDRVYDAKALEVLSIEKADLDASASGSNIASEAKGTSSPAKICIANLIKLVNGDARKYLPVKNSANQFRGDAIPHPEQWTTERIKNGRVTEP